MKYKSKLEKYFKPEFELEYKTTMGNMPTCQPSCGPCGPRPPFCR